MYRRRDGIVTENMKERQQWYAEMQAKMFANPPEPEISDDEAETNNDNDSCTIETKNTSKESKPNTSQMKSSSGKDSKTQHSQVQNFAAMLAVESATSRELFSVKTSSTTLSLEKTLKQYPIDILTRSLLRLNSPAVVTTTLICLSGFGDNGLTFSKYSDVFAEQQIELISFEFPGRLERIHESCFESVSEYVDFILSALVHHNYLLQPKTQSSNQSIHSSSVQSNVSIDQLTLDEPLLDASSLALFGHNLGGIIAFEVARAIEKGTLVALPHPPLQCLIVSGCRPPQALTQFNKDEKSRKFSKDTDKALMDRLIELGCVPAHLRSRRDIIGLYLSRFRSDYLALESYRLLRSLGTKNEPFLTCPITAVSGSNDKSVSERLLLQWEEMTSGEFNSQIFDRGGHYYWMEDQTHEDLFLRMIIQYTNPTHTLLNLKEDNDDSLEGYEDKSTVSSVSFQDSFLDSSVVDRQSLNSSQERRGLKSSDSFSFGMRTKQISRLD